MSLIKPLLPIKSCMAIGCCALALTACGTSSPSGHSPGPEATASLPTATGSAPEINSFTFDEIDLRGCGMTLWAPGRDPRTDGVYLFNGLQPPDGSPKATMRMKIDGRIMPFQRTEAEGEEYYGQFERQTFTSVDGGLTAEVNSEVTSKPENSEVWGVQGTITVINADGQETSVEAIGDAGC